MSDEPREFPVTLRAGDYALLPEPAMDVGEASDDSDGASSPQSPRDPRPVLPAISKLRSRPVALIPHDPTGDMFGPNTNIIGEATSYVAANDLPGLEEVDDEFVHWQPVGSAYGPNAGGGSHHGFATDADAVHNQPAAFVPGFVAPRLDTANQRYEDRLRETVSAAVDATPLHQVTFRMVQLACVDEARHVSQKHHILLQRAFSLPGFRPECSSSGVYVDDRGEPHPYGVYVPYVHRRLWVSLLATTAGEAAADPDPKAVVAGRVARIFEVALRVYSPGIHTLYSRAFARLVSHRLTHDDGAFRDFNVTSDIKFAINLFACGRFRYRYARQRGYITSGHEDAPDVDVFRRAQRFADDFLRLALDAEVADPAVEESHCPDTDIEEAAASLVAHSNRPHVVPAQPSPDGIPWLGYGPDPHDDSDSDL